MKITVSLDCASLEEAVVALGKLMGGKPAKAAAAQIEKAEPEVPRQTIEERAGLTDVPAESGPLAGLALPKKTRKQRSDKGARRNKPQSAAAEALVVPAATAGEPPEVSAAVEVSPPSAAAETEAPATLDEAQDALEAVFKAKGLTKAQELLGQFGAARLRDLPAAKYGAFVALVKSVL